MRAGFETSLAADAFLRINHAHVAVRLADMTGAGRAIHHTKRLGTLPAGSDLNIVGIARKDGAAHLDAGE